MNLYPKGSETRGGCATAGLRVVSPPRVREVELAARLAQPALPPPVIERRRLDRCVAQQIPDRDDVHTRVQQVPAHYVDISDRKLELESFLEITF